MPILLTMVQRFWLGAKRKSSKSKLILVKFEVKFLPVNCLIATDHHSLPCDWWCLSSSTRVSLMPYGICLCLSWSCLRISVSIESWSCQAKVWVEHQSLLEVNQILLKFSLRPIGTSSQLHLACTQWHWRSLCLLTTQSYVIWLMSNHFGTKSTCLAQDQNLWHQDNLHTTHCSEYKTEVTDCLKWLWGNQDWELFSS